MSELQRAIESARRTVAERDERDRQQRLKALTGRSAERQQLDQDTAYMATPLVQATLPHSDPGNVPLYVRRNGNLTFSIQPGADPRRGALLGYPYGSLPRLLLYWITTEAKLTKSPTLELGPNLRQFMLEIGLNPNNGRGARSDARRLSEQMRRLFRARLSISYEINRPAQRGEGWLDMQVAPRGHLFWDPRDPGQDALWGSWIELDPKFFEMVMRSAVPMDTHALKALKRSPLALDLYAWSTYVTDQANRLGKPRSVAWKLLQQQFGSEYTNPKDFKRKAKATFVKIAEVYPGLRMEFVRGGIAIKPGSPAIARQPAGPAALLAPQTKP